ncbi:4'-phosphopantetheinyl transferase [Streptomyces avidinii]|uniref:4'-phosphopantetheinyl transferase family protein n=1 Tax=Streptomyces avidinii TaxID=1895 RepID=UPI0019A5061B|nr:4'-phosphopantetheinyl transferase superfamily protein [Streptomyces avidinii]GGZ23579.1 4'-phosphopantetheinyl transferase [Streptomyces avidinii]
MFGTPPPSPPLFAQEARLIEGVVERRRSDFTTVRTCARRAMGRLGFPPAPILRGPRGEPLWPPGLVGSMTHCDGYRAAALARAEDLASLGVDAEVNDPLPREGMLRIVTTEEERAWLAPMIERRPDVAWDRLVFSAKESVYKAWYPLTGRWLDFQEAVITVDPDLGTFAARLLVPGPLVGSARLSDFPGRWTTERGFLMTAVALPAPSRPDESPTTPPPAR